MLGVLRRTWAPEAFIVSFKLETDEGLLITKVPTQAPKERSPVQSLPTSCSSRDDAY